MIKCLTSSFVFSWIWSYTIPGQWFRRTDTVGTGRKDAEKSPYLAGKHGKALETGSSIPVGSYRIFFLWIPVSFLCFPVSFLCFTSGSWSESTGKKSGNFQLEYCFHFPALSCAFRPFPSVRPRPGYLPLESCWIVVESENSWKMYIWHKTVSIVWKWFHIWKTKSFMI